MTIADHTAIELRHAYSFRVTDARMLRLPPRSVLRVVRATVSRHTSAANPTLLFSSLLQSPHYQELVLTQHTLPACGKHGPFTVQELSPADFREKLTEPLFSSASRALSAASTC